MLCKNHSTVYNRCLNQDNFMNMNHYVEIKKVLNFDFLEKHDFNASKYGLFGIV